jgi:hypothetical protein
MQTVLLSARRLSCYESVGCQGVTGLWHSICYMRRQGFLVGGHAESTHPQCHCPDESSNAIGSLADVLLTRFPVADQLAPGVCVQQPIYLYIYYQIQGSLSTKYLHVRQFPIFVISRWKHPQDSSNCIEATTQPSSTSLTSLETQIY